VTTIEEHSEDLEAVEGESDESDPWSHFQLGDFESVGGGGGRKGGRSGSGASTGSAAAWLVGEGLQFKRPVENKPNWLGVNTVRSRHGWQFFWCADLFVTAFSSKPNI